MHLAMEVVNMVETVNVSKKVVAVAEHPKNQKTL